MRRIYIRAEVVTLALLAGCSGGNVQGVTPQAAPHAVHGIAAPASATRGIYAGLANAGQGPAILGYTTRNRKNKPPVCTAMPGGGAEDIAVDNNGNVMIATGGGEEVMVLQGPGMCGPPLGQIYTNGITFDVASADAANGTIVVGNVYGNSGVGDVVVCSLSAGCTAALVNPSVVSLFGVALAKNGDCWASAEGFGTPSTMLVYFKHCSGSGQLATGFKNASAGGLDIDKHGNLVSVDAGTQIWVYKGCNPGCTLIGGPFAEQGGAYYGHLDRNSSEFAAADYQYGQIDIYKYAPTKITYEYSFNNGLSASSDLIGAAYAPRSKE